MKVALLYQRASTGLVYRAWRAKTKAPPDGGKQSSIFDTMSASTRRSSCER